MMFSGLVFKTIRGMTRSAVVSVVAFVGLFLLCMPTARAADTQVLSVYITNAGAWLTYGTSAKEEPLYQNALSTWENSELFGHPPNLVFNDSPLVLFRKLIKESASDLKTVIDKSQPLNVYLAAAGADAAAEMPIPDSSALVNILTSAQNERCYKHDKNRAAFFACAFGEEIREQVLDNADTVTVELEQDNHLITAMAAIHSGTETPDEAAIVVHSTTIGKPYLVVAGKARSLENWVPESLNRNGGIYQIGKLLQGYLNDNQDSDNPLRYVLERDPVAANHPEGVKANMKRLQLGKGFNNFGHIAGETANGFNERRIKLDFAHKAIFAQAQNTALPMLESAREDMIRLAAMLYALEEGVFAGKTPRLIIVGEEANIMFNSESTFRTAAGKLFSQKDGIFPAELYASQPAMKDPAKQQTWLKEKGIPFIDRVTILPVSQMPGLQHQAALKKMDTRVQPGSQAQQE